MYYLHVTTLRVLKWKKKKKKKENCWIFSMIILEAVNFSLCLQKPGEVCALSSALCEQSSW